MVGDRIDTDLVGAKKLGMTTIWYNPSNKPNEDDLRPDYEISDFSQIVEGMKEGSAGRCLGS